MEAIRRGKFDRDCRPRFFEISAPKLPESVRAFTNLTSVARMELTCKALKLVVERLENSIDAPNAIIPKSLVEGLLPS
uniref:Uncharacterized protein n=1 Tax=Fervidicoccus fontis TaxID=683846 RepID=A0A7J3ZK97_9CREN